MSFLSHDNVGGGGIVAALNAKVYGNGNETLVLSHGYGSDQTVWHFLVPYLACYFKLIVFDLVISPNVDPEFYNPRKYSSFEGYADDLISLLDQLNVTRTIYVGHSMSAMIGCLAATKRPELFQHLVLLNGSPRYLNTKGYYGGFERSDIDSIFISIEGNFSNWVQNFVPKAISVNNRAAVSETERSLERMKPNIALSAAKTVFLSDLKRELPEVVVPCTIIQSSKDNIVPKFVAFYMKKEIGSHAKMKILKAQGHFPHLTAYPLLLKVLKGVLHIKG
ncbi:hypothetical protein SLA2020_347400 [Shorea laevis]